MNRRFTAGLCALAPGLITVYGCAGEVPRSATSVPSAVSTKSVSGASSAPPSVFECIDTVQPPNTDVQPVSINRTTRVITSRFVGPAACRGVISAHTEVAICRATRPGRLVEEIVIPNQKLGDPLNDRVIKKRFSTRGAVVANVYRSYSRINPDDSTLFIGPFRLSGDRRCQPASVR